MGHYKASFESPSNIAIVKYWGKKGIQKPINPSMSFTLSESKTNVLLEVDTDTKYSFQLYFEDKLNDKFKLKIEKKFEVLKDIFPWLLNSKIVMRSYNTFPHSAGIASSASAMSALAAAIVKIDNKINNNNFESDYFYKWVSQISRILSGSASRSIYPFAAGWGESQYDSLFSDDYAIGLESKIHIKFKYLNDAILIIDENEKSVSSSVGHELMINHPHKDSRIAHARKNLKGLMSALESGDFKEFARISELEAFDLHSMMMTSNPSFILLKPNSLEAINKINEFKKSSSIEMTFTIDAGPNIHVLFFEKDKEKVMQFLNSEILKNNIAKKIIYDRVGNGLKEVEVESY